MTTGPRHTRADNHGKPLRDAHARNRQTNTDTAPLGGREALAEAARLEAARVYTTVVTPAAPRPTQAERDERAYLEAVARNAAADALRRQLYVIRGAAS